MTWRDKITRRRAKGLWTGASADGPAATADTVRRLPAGLQAPTRARAAYKPPVCAGDEGRGWTIRFEAVLGKTRRTEF